MKKYKYSIYVSCTDSGLLTFHSDNLPRTQDGMVEIYGDNKEQGYTIKLFPIHRITAVTVFEE